MLLDDERRDFRRMIAETQMEVTELANGETFTAQLVNLSASGCAFRSDRPLSTDDRLRIVISGSSDRLEPLVRTGSIARVTDEDDGRLLAVQFEPETP